MTLYRVQSVPAASGEIPDSGERRVSRAARERAVRRTRRRWLIMFAVLLLVVVGILANIGPLTHLQDASARYEQVSADVSALQAQKEELQSHLARLSESDYLETLARQQLTYARPGEDLYIVTGSEDSVAGGSTGDSGVPVVTPGLGAALETSLGANGSLPTGNAEDLVAPDDQPGFFERLLSGIRDLL